MSLCMYTLQPTADTMLLLDRMEKTRHMILFSPDFLLYFVYI